MPAAITFDKNGSGAYVLKEYWVPKDGSGYLPSIREKFPSDLPLDLLDTQKYVLTQTQNCYAQAIVYGKIDTITGLPAILKTICSSPAVSSRPGDYIEAHPAEYRELLYCGDYTLEYAYSEFLRGGQTGLAGHILLSAMQDLLGGEARSLAQSGTAQTWFDQWKGYAVQLRSKNSIEFMQEKYPKTALMLQMMDQMEKQ